MDKEYDNHTLKTFERIAKKVWQKHYHATDTTFATDARFTEHEMNLCEEVFGEDD